MRPWASRATRTASRIQIVRPSPAIARYSSSKSRPSRRPCFHADRRVLPVLRHDPVEPEAGLGQPPLRGLAEELLGAPADEREVAGRRVGLPDDQVDPLHQVVVASPRLLGLLAPTLRLGVRRLQLGHQPAVLAPALPVAQARPDGRRELRRLDRLLQQRGVEPPGGQVGQHGHIGRIGQQDEGQVAAFGQAVERPEQVAQGAVSAGGVGQDQVEPILGHEPPQVRRRLQGEALGPQRVEEPADQVAVAGPAAMHQDQGATLHVIHRSAPHPRASSPPRVPVPGLRPRP